MPVHPQAGKLPTADVLVSLPGLVAAYYTEEPSPDVPEERIAFGTSGHRGSSLKRTFNEAHIRAVTQAVCDVRRKAGITGPLFLGVDTHALSEPAGRTALQVLAANNVAVRVADAGGVAGAAAAYTPTPVISHAILEWNRAHPEAQADGIVITPSHNPPDAGGFKYNPPHGGPADTAVTRAIEERANALLKAGNREVASLPWRKALAQATAVDYIGQYVAGLERVLDMQAIAGAGLKLKVDPLGGASLAYWQPIAERYKLDLTVVNPELDATFRFVPRDHDGKIRMDCSSPYAMTRLLEAQAGCDLAFGCDPDSDRHGIVTARGLMNPNHYLATVVEHLLQTRKQWPAGAGIGKTLVTSAMLDRVAAGLGRNVVEVPVGFKWFVPYLHNGQCGMGCEESAGGSFLCRDGAPWSTDKDGPLLCLLAAEMMAVQGKSPAERYRELEARYGEAAYARVDSPADQALRDALKAATPESVSLREVAGAPVTAVLTRAPGNDAPIGGLKVVTADGWFAIRPSGTEDICKLYAESFKGEAHLRQIQADAQGVLAALLAQ